ncbi:MAG: hypothetical protein KJ864_05530 [Candidatus Omnitrophica bacterium]|nr:hypothetical protein [Candidatus Omnitrophota bacterium]
MGIMEAVKNGFGKAFKLMNVILVFFVFNTIIGLIGLPLSNPARTGEPGMIAISIASSILFFLIFVFLQGGAMGLAKDQIKTGASSMANFLSYVKKFYLRILGLLFLYVLIAIGIVLVLSLLTAGVLLLGDNIITRSLVAAIVTIIAIVAITMLVYPIYVVVVEDTSTLDAFRKGLKTAKNNFKNTLGLFMTLFLISLVISLIAGFIAGLIMVPLSPNLGQILIAVVNAAVQAYIPVVMILGFMGFYMSLSKGAEKTSQESAI